MREISLSLFCNNIPSKRWLYDNISSYANHVLFHCTQRVLIIKVRIEK